jgi:hypothetical protein
VHTMAEEESFFIVFDSGARHLEFPAGSADGSLVALPVFLPGFLFPAIFFRCLQLQYYSCTFYRTEKRKNCQYNEYLHFLGFKYPKISIILSSSAWADR